jgi:hypothetical protein
MEIVGDHDLHDLEHFLRRTSADIRELAQGWMRLGILLLLPA